MISQTIAKVILLACILFLFGVADFIKHDREMGNKIYPNVFIDTIAAGGKTKEDIEALFDKKNQTLDSLQFTFVYNGETVSTLTGKQMNLHYDGKGIADRLFLIGRSSHLTSKLYQKLATNFGWNRFTFESWLDYDKQSIREIISNIEEKYNKPAKNALFKFENGKVVSFREEEKGIQIESESLAKQFNVLISDIQTHPSDKTVQVSSRVIEPEITLSHVNTYGIEELIGEGRSNFSHSFPERVHNIIVASSKFNGILIPTDKVLSFNDTVGDISSLTGYKQAYIIKDGKTVLGDGGGVCQVSTTLFRAALNAGLQIVERTAHAYRVGYYENDSKPGFDATVYAPSVDLKIKSNTPSYILIETEVDTNNGLLIFRLYGKKDGRQITISPVTLTDQEPPPAPQYQNDPTLKKGVVKQIDFAAWGGKAYFTYRVTRESQTLLDQKFYSVYKPWQAIYLQGTAD